MSRGFLEAFPGVLQASIQVKNKYVHALYKVTHLLKRITAFGSNTTDLTIQRFVLPVFKS